MRQVCCLLAILVVYCVNSVQSESCTGPLDCANTRCVPGGTVVCQHRIGSVPIPGGGLCTCAHSECVGSHDCFSDLAPSLTCHNAMRHCLDSQCICDQFPSGDAVVHVIG